MPRIDETYPDKYLKAQHIDEMLQDTDDEHVVFTIRSTDMAEYRDGKKQIVLRFREIDLELGLNKTNAEACASAFDSMDSDDWVGKKIALHSEEVRNTLSPTGKSMAVRVSSKQTLKANRALAPTRPPSKAPGKPARHATQADADAIAAGREPGDDDIPF